MPSSCISSLSVLFAVIGVLLILLGTAPVDVPAPADVLAPTDVSSDTFTATIDGEAYEGQFAVAVRRCVIPSRCTISVRTRAEITSGQDAPPMTTLRFTLSRAQDAPATYDLTRLSRANVERPNDAGGTTTYSVSGDAGSGSVEVTSITEGGFKGTFQFTAVADDGSTVEVTDGSFDLEFT